MRLLGVRFGGVEQLTMQELAAVQAQFDQAHPGPAESVEQAKARILALVDAVTDAAHKKRVILKIKRKYGIPQ